MVVGCSGIEGRLTHLPVAYQYEWLSVVVIKTYDMWLILKQVSICTERGCSVSFGIILC